MDKQTHTFWKPQTTLIVLTLVLSLLGLLFVFDASLGEAYATFNDQYHFLRQHAVWLGLGLFGLVTARFIPLDWWQKLSRPLYLLGLILLALVFVPGIGRELNGAHRWLFLGQLRLQPIEFFKLTLVIFFADWLSQHQRLLPFLFTFGLPAVLLLLQPDLGSLLVISLIAFALFFLAGGHWSHLLVMIGGGTAIILLAILTSSYRLKRLKTFFNPQTDPLGASFHIRQITLALGRGGWFGQGLGNSRQKFAYIPEASTDSIFAVIAEEVGFVGSSLILSLFFFFFLTATKIIRQTDEGSFTNLLGWGIFIWIAGQAFLNLAAILAIVPLTGLPLPFFSYGGSSLVMILFATGILWRIGHEAAEQA